MTGKMFPAPEEQRDPAAILQKPEPIELQPTTSSAMHMMEEMESIRPGSVIHIEDPRRDVFACAALTGILSRCEVGSNQLKVMAEDCYRIADAMLAARKGK